MTFFMFVRLRPFENCEETFIYYNPTQYLTLNSKEKQRPYSASSNSNSSSNLNSLTKTSNETGPAVKATLQIRSTPEQSQEETAKPDEIVESAAIEVTKATNETDPVNHHLTQILSSSSSSSSSSSTSSLSSSSKKKAAEAVLDQTANDNDTIKDASKEDSNRLSMNSLCSSSCKHSYCCSTSSASNLSNTTSSSLNENDLALLNTSLSEVSKDSKVLTEVELLLNELLDRLSTSEQHSNEIESQKSIISVNKYRVKSQHRQMLNALLAKLEIKLDELRAFYIELNDLHEHFRLIERLVDRHLRKKQPQVHDRKPKEETVSESTSLSMLLDDVLQYFDFLNVEGASSVADLETDSMKTKNFDTETSKSNLILNRRQSTNSTASSSSSESSLNFDSNSYFDLHYLFIIHVNNLIVLLDVRIELFHY